MRTLAALLAATALVAGPVMAQNLSPNDYIKNGADTGAPRSQDTAGSKTAGQPSSGAASATSAQNSEVGISGAPGGKSGPGTTTGAAGNSTVQQQDSAHVKGLNGNKSGSPAKR